VKVAHLVHSLLPDGPAGSLVDLAAVAGQARLELVVIAICSTPDRRTAAALRGHGVPVVELGLAPWDPRAVPRTVRVLRDHRAELVHTHLRHADVTGAAAATRLRLPMVSTLHRIENIPADRLDRLRRTAKILARRRFVARTVAISQVQRDRYRRLAGSGRNLVVVPNGVTDPGVPTPAQRERVRGALGLPAGLLAVSAAPMRRGQGHDLLLDAVATLPAAPQLTVVLAGDGPLRPWLASRVAADEALRGRVRFESRHGDVRGLLGAADLVLHTTQADALPATLLQALAVGVPTVATAVGGIPEIVTRETGIVVPLDADRITEAIVRLTTDADLRARLGAGARARFLAQFEAAGWARRLGAVYEGVLAGR
jgi:glycosyltransferase involved in cell wall biosynthesis